MSTGPQHRSLTNLVEQRGLHTVCQEAVYPNIFESWESKESTFLIGGHHCTRRRGLGRSTPDGLRRSTRMSHAGSPLRHRDREALR